MEAFSSKLRASGEPAKVGKDTFLVRPLSGAYLQLLTRVQGVIWGGVVTSFLFVVMRMIARWSAFKRFYFDDAFVLFAWLLTLGTAIVWQIIARNTYQFVAITSGQLWPPPPSFVADTEGFFHGELAALMFYYSGLWAIKISFLIFFRRLGQNVSGQKVIWWSIFAFTAATYLVCIGTTDYSCIVAPLPEIFANCATIKLARLETAKVKIDAAMDILTDFMSCLAPCWFKTSNTKALQS